jgi:hypothetical protein
VRAERERRDAEQRERDRARRERSAAVARQRHLGTIAVDQPAAWQRVDELIVTKRPREYDTAVQLLNATQLFAEIQALGYRGTCATLRSYLRPFRTAAGRVPARSPYPTWTYQSSARVRTAK